MLSAWDVLLLKFALGAYKALQRFDPYIKHWTGDTRKSHIGVTILNPKFPTSLVVFFAFTMSLASIFPKSPCRMFQQDFSYAVSLAVSRARHDSTWDIGNPGSLEQSWHSWSWWKPTELALGHYLKFRCALCIYHPGSIFRLSLSEFLSSSNALSECDWMTDIASSRYENLDYAAGYALSFNISGWGPEIAIVP